jgi:hypothetical protein
LLDLESDRVAHADFSPAPARDATLDDHRLRQIVLEVAAVLGGTASREESNQGDHGDERASG